MNTQPKSITSSDSTNHAQRQQIRQEVRATRQRLTEQQQLQAEEELLSLLTAQSHINSANKIAIYLTNDGELNTNAFINWCWQQNKKVYLPVIHPFTAGNLLFLEYTNQTKLIANQYGILEPKLAANTVTPIAEIDIIFTPLVAFDESGERLGMGGGFYDRTLSNWSKGLLPNTTPIGLAHDCQKVKKVPTEEWDIAIPEIITPTKRYVF